MDLCDQDDGDLLSRVLEQAAATTVPPRAARPRDPGTGQPGEVWTLPGILGPTRVTTSFGHVPAHLVRVGDTLRTQDGSYERVRRISDLKIDEDFLARHPEAAPVVLRRASLEKGLPHQDVLLSPAQQVALGPNRFEARPVAAGDLSRERGGIDKSLGMIVYLRFHLDRPAQICCDGVWVAAETD